MAMKFAGVQDIKKELQLLPPKKLQDLCLRMAKYRKENKELLAFLLFESDDKHVFIDELRAEISAELAAIAAQQNLFFLKKNLRRILRLLNRYIKYIDDKALTADLLLFFCQELKAKHIPVHKNTALKNLYGQQLKKISTLANALHEDLRQDYISQLDELAID